MYSFGRAQRFPRLGGKSNMWSFYNLPNVQMTRSTSFGYGTKYDFTIGSKSKSPVFYDFQSDFDQRRPHGPKYSFGLGRDRMYRFADCSGPGAGKYFTGKVFGSEASKYTMRPKLARSSSMGSLKTPGPGAYNSVTFINPNGTFIKSQNENVHPVEFSKDKSKRFNYNYEISPGPSDYKKESLFGKIFESRFRSTNGVTMRPKCQINDSRSQYPGPGAYRFFSEFGIYEKKDNGLNSSMSKTSGNNKS